MKNPTRWKGRTRTRKRSKMFSFRITLDELQVLTAEADRRQLSLSQLVREALEKLFGSQPSQGS
jgi:hypothetical protein